MITALAGILLLAMILLTTLNGMFQPAWPVDIEVVAGLCGWMAASLLFLRTSTALKIQVGILLLTGAGLIAYVATTDNGIDISPVIGANTGLLSMIAAVGFLRLVALPDHSEVEKLPRGKTAFLQTIAGLNITGSIINISAPILIGDRIHRTRPLDRLSIQSFTRAFCAAASWSPFFAAMAVVLTYVKGAELSALMIYGVPFTVTGVLLTMLEARLRFPEDMKAFVGYPARPTALAVPLLLVIVVIVFTLVSSTTPILIIISLCALLITVFLLVIRKGLSSALKRLKDHVFHGLPQMQNELCLFLAAGVLATGISLMIDSGQLASPLPFFNHQVAGLLLLGMLLMSVLGIHPVIQISSMTSLLLPLEPDPNLLAATYLYAWHLGTCTSPLSGTNLVFQGRYGVPAWRIMLWNLPYALIMVLLGGIWLWVTSSFLN